MWAKDDDSSHNSRTEDELENKGKKTSFINRFFLEIWTWWPDTLISLIPPLLSRLGKIGRIYGINVRNRCRISVLRARISVVETIENLEGGGQDLKGTSHDLDPELLDEISVTCDVCFRFESSFYCGALKSSVAHIRWKDPRATSW